MVAGEIPWAAARCLNCESQASKPVPSSPQAAARVTDGRMRRRRKKTKTPGREAASLAADTCELIPFPSLAATPACHLLACAAGPVLPACRGNMLEMRAHRYPAYP